MLHTAWLFVVHGMDVMSRWLVQEHKNIPYIVARLGLHDKQLFWGDVPDSKVRHGPQCHA